MNKLKKCSTWNIFLQNQKLVYAKKTKAISTSKKINSQAMVNSNKLIPSLFKSARNSWIGLPSTKVAVIVAETTKSVRKSIGAKNESSIGAKRSAFLKNKATSEMYASVPSALRKPR